MFTIWEANRFLKELYLEMVNEMLNKDKETEKDDEQRVVDDTNE
jgi:hypothetical protein